MLEQFDQAVRGMKVGEAKTFPLQFPADYHGAEVAGREADFMVTMKKIEAQHLPEVDDAFAKSLGIADGTVAGLRAAVRKNNLQAKPEQLQAHIEEMSQSYEKPVEVQRWYLSDRSRMAEVEAIVVE